MPYNIDVSKYLQKLQSPSILAKTIITITRENQRIIYREIDLDISLQKKTTNPVQERNIINLELNFHTIRNNNAAVTSLEVSHWYLTTYIDLK